MKGLDKALVGHPALQALDLVTCVYKVKKDNAENTLPLYPEIFKGLSKLTCKFTIS